MMIILISLVFLGISCKFNIEDIATPVNEAVEKASEETAEETTEEEVPQAEQTIDEEAVEESGETEEEAVEEVEGETEEAAEEKVEEVLTAPTIRLEIIEGPTLTTDGVCYYRVKAHVTGNPYPAISFNKDDSLGSWGKNISQVNLHKEGESFTLEATATNSQGTTSASMTLTDTCERPIVEVKEEEAVSAEETVTTGSEIPILIINDLGATLSLSISGPHWYLFNIPPGRQTIYVIPGNYYYTGRCSGAVLSGTYDLSRSGSGEWRWWWE